MCDLYSRFFVVVFFLKGLLSQKTLFNNFKLFFYEKESVFGNA